MCTISDTSESLYIPYYGHMIRTQQSYCIVSELHNVDKATPTSVIASVSYRGWGALGFPTPKLKFPPSRFSLTAIVCITFPPQMASAPQHSYLKSHGSV